MVGKTRWQTTAPVASLPIREREDLLAVESPTGTAVIVRSIIGESCSDAQLADLLGAKGHDLRQLDLRKCPELSGAAVPCIVRTSR